MSNQPKAFISYASEDRDFAELIKMKLESKGVEIWSDIHKIQPGDEWRKQIDYGLLNSDVVIVLLNTNSAKSSYVTYEWAFALGNGKKIIPLLLEECEIHPRMSVLQFVDFQHQKRPWDQVVNRIMKIHNDTNKAKPNEDSLSIEQIIEGIQALASASKDEQNSTHSSNIQVAASKMINASNYLKSVNKALTTILWVDDNPDNNIYERKAFKSLGFKFDLALNTDEALELLSSKDYAAIISDMGRTEGPQEGYVLLKVVRKRDKRTPFFIYASSNKIEHKIMAQERGAQGSTNRADELIDLVTTHVQSQPESTL